MSTTPPDRTPARLAFDLAFGFAVPAACLTLDPLVFRGGLGGGPLLGPYAVAGYAAVALGMAALAGWLLAGRPPALLAGLLAGGGGFALGLGLLLLPLSLIGLAVAIGVLGFTPLLTAAVWVADPLFEGSTRSRLGDPAVEQAVRVGVGRALRAQLEANPEVAGRVVRAAASRPSGGPVRTAEEWEGTDDAPRMLRCVGGGGRKAALLLAACLRARPGEPDRALAAALEEYADGAVDAAGLRRVPAVDPAVRRLVEAVTAPGFGPAAARRPTLAICREDGNWVAALAGRVRDIFGNPFRPVAIDMSWLSSTAVALARQMYDSRDFSAMPILADALQDAGCENEQMLRHCRGPGPHVRGCWVVDLILAKG